MIAKAVSHYLILKKLGAGGMGEVYLAEDTNLRRKVAIKFLSPDLTKNRTRLRRFEQEAYSASALSHPNILVIYEIGSENNIHFIATEYIEGVTLRKHMAKSSMTLREVLDIAIQVASALAAAHKAGIVHRDIKPENIMLREDGYVKVLDFGLAKLTEQQAPATNTEAPTVAKIDTDPGVLVGTVNYMSPEQARGRAVDTRSDIFSLGIVLYEMIAGRAPFEGESSGEILAAILYSEPTPLARYARGVPDELERIVSKALRKDKEERYQTVKDLLLDLKNLRQELEFEAKLERSLSPDSVSKMSLSTGGGAAVTAAMDSAAESGQVAPRPTSSAEYLVSEIKKHKRGAALMLGILVIVTAAVVFSLYELIARIQSRSGTPAGLARVVPFTSFPGSERDPAFSPDGKMLAFVWDGDKGNDDIYVKLVGAGTPLQLTTDPAAEINPVWSPDASHIAFVRLAGEKSGIYLVPSLGGPERRLYATYSSGASPIASGLSWSPDGKLLAFAERSSPEHPYCIYLLSVDSLEKQKLTSPPEGAVGDNAPVFSPDSRLVGFNRAGGVDAHDLYVVPVTGGEPKRLTFDSSPTGNMTWSKGGSYIVFASRRGSGVYNMWRLPSSGGAPELVPAVGQNAHSPAFSNQGDRLAYTQLIDDRNIWRMAVSASTNQASSPTKFISSTLADTSPHYSPDGKRIAFASNRTGSWEIWTCNADGTNPVALTSSRGRPTGTPRWSPDSRQIAFDSRPDGNADIFIVGADGGKPRRLTSDASEDIAPSWSRDGRSIYFGSNRSGTMQVWKVPAEGGEAVQVTKQGGFEGYESYDGKYFYYAKGRYLPGIWRVSVEGGEEVPLLDHHRAGYWRLWTVAEKGIFFATAEDPSRPLIEFFSFDTGKISLVSTLGKSISTGTLTLSPDGKWLLYTQLDQWGSDIMLAENFQ